MKEDELVLAYARCIGTNVHDMFEYEFFFTKTPEIVWGQDWAELCPSACGDMTPDSTTYTTIKRLASIIPFGFAQENSCFSMQDCIDGIIALVYEDISEYTEYPEPSRLIFQFGESLESVEDKLAQRHQFFYKDKSEEENKETENPEN